MIQMEISEIKKMSEQGNCAAMKNLAARYYSGIDSPKDLAKSIEWYEKAYDAGDVEAAYYLGCIYYSEIKDYETAFAYYNIARLLGDSSISLKSKQIVARCYYLGEGIGQDYGIAKELYLEMADNNPEAAYYLGEMFRLGHGVKEDESVAVDWYKKAIEYCESNHLAPHFMTIYNMAMYRLGVCYIEGIGIEKNKELAKKWLQKSLEQGNAVAEKMLRSINYRLEDDDLRIKEPVILSIKEIEKFKMVFATSPIESKNYQDFKKRLEEINLKVCMDENEKKIVHEILENALEESPLYIRAQNRLQGVINIMDIWLFESLRSQIENYKKIYRVDYTLDSSSFDIYSEQYRKYRDRFGNDWYEWTKYYKNCEDDEFQEYSRMVALHEMSKEDPIWREYYRAVVRADVKNDENEKIDIEWKKSNLYKEMMRYDNNPMKRIEEYYLLYHCYRTKFGFDWYDRNRYYKKCKGKTDSENYEKLIALYELSMESLEWKNVLTLIKERMEAENSIRWGHPSGQTNGGASLN